MDFLVNCNANDAISDSNMTDLDVSESPSVQSLDVSAYDLRWWVTEALQVLSTTQNAVEQRLIPWLLSHKSNSSNLRMHNEGSKWKCPPSFDTLDGGGTAKLLDQEICGPLREIPFEDWVRTALYDPCDAMNKIIEKARVIHKQMFPRRRNNVHQAKALHQMVEDVGLETIDRVAR